MLAYIHMLGMDFLGWEPSAKQARRIIGQLQGGTTPADAAYQNGIPEGCWKVARGTIKQINALSHRGVPNAHLMKPIEISEAFKRLKQGLPAVQQSSELFHTLADKIETSGTHDHLTAISREVSAMRQQLGEEEYKRLIEIGAKQRQQVY